MGLDFAIDELYATGWSTLDTRDCAHTANGRVYPLVDRVRREFERAGYTLTIRFVQLFDCHRAEWSDAAGAPVGAVVGQSDQEAAVYALAQMRRQSARVGA